MVTLALITKNKCIFNELDKYVPQLLYYYRNDNDRNQIKQNINNYIWSIIEPYISFITVSYNNNDCLSHISNNLIKCFPDKTVHDFYYLTEPSYSLPKKIIEIVYCQPLFKDPENDNVHNINNIGCLFSINHRIINNNCVLIANKYDDNAQKNISIESITKEDILRIIRRRYFHSAILIKNDTFEKYYYQSPKYLIMQIFGCNDSDNIERISITHHGYQLTFYFRYNCDNNINKIATRINGLYQLNGDVLILHEYEKDIYANISIHEAKRLNVLSYGCLNDRQIKSETGYFNYETETDTNTIIPVWNRYIAVNNKIKEWNNNKNNCINCKKKITTKYICNKCFRAIYCSDKCKESHLKLHDEDCIKAIK